MTLPDGPHNFYAGKSTHPILVEVSCGYVAEVGEENWRPLSQYAGGRFIPLRECPEDAQGEKEGKSDESI